MVGFIERRMADFRHSRMAEVAGKHTSNGTSF